VIARVTRFRRDLRTLDPPVTQNSERSRVFSVVAADRRSASLCGHVARKRVDGYAAGRGASGHRPLAADNRCGSHALLATDGADDTDGMQ